MAHSAATLPPVNDNRDLYDTPEGACFQILKAKRRHVQCDTRTMSAERYQEWQSVLDGLNEGEQLALAWLRQRASAPPAGAIPVRLHALARRLLGWLRPRPGRGRR